MPSPTPNGPTLNDLMYGGYNPDGYLNVTTKTEFYLVNAVEIARTNENLVLNFVGLSTNLDFSETLNTIENVQVSLGLPGPNNFSASVSDTITTSEHIVATEV